jgi:hypothetical protein
MVEKEFISLVVITSDFHVREKPETKYFHH